MGIVKIMETSMLHALGIFVTINLIFLVLTAKVLSMDAIFRYRILLVQYLIIAESLFILVTKGLYHKMVHNWPRRSLPGITIRIVLIPIFLLGQSLILLHMILTRTEPHHLSFIAGYCFGFLMLMMGCLIVVEVLFFLFQLISKFDRKKIVQVTLDATKRNSNQERVLVLITFVLSCFSFFVAARNCAFPEVTRIQVPIKGLPASFNNTVIVQLSDLHIGFLNGETALSKVVKTANSLNPDIVAITGDTAEGSIKHIKQPLQPLKDLKSKYGVYITTGNHDYYTADVDKLIDLWQSLGLVVLHNTNIFIKNGQNDGFNLVGMDDTEGKLFRGGQHGPDYERALKDRNPNAPTILFSHRPTVSKRAMMKYGNIQLALSGHTHGGQFPLSGLYHYLSEAYFSGLYKFDESSYVYVSNGVFYWASPLRLLHKGEIVHVTLISA